MSDPNRYRDNRDRPRDDDRSRSGGGFGRDMSRGGERDFSERASDEVSSWFGDDDASRRRREDAARTRGGYISDYGAGRDRDRVSNRGDVGYGGASYGRDFGSDRDWADPSGYGRRSSPFGGSDGYNRDYGQRFDRQTGDRQNNDGQNNARQDNARQDNFGPGGYGREYDRSYGRGVVRSDDRGFWDRASDEVSSWFGDENAAQRRRQDEVQDNRGRGPRGYTRSDDRIREQICDRLTDDHRVDASDIDVTVADGEVTLAGTVGNREARRRAEDIAESCAGDKHVQNNLRVKNADFGSTGSAMGGSAGTSGLGSGGVSSPGSVGTSTTSATGTSTGTDTGTGLGTGLGTPDAGLDTKLGTNTIA